MIDLSRQKLPLPFDYIGTLIAAFHASRRCPGVFLGEKKGTFYAKTSSFCPKLHTKRAFLSPDYTLSKHENTDFNRTPDLIPPNEDITSVTPSKWKIIKDALKLNESDKAAALSGTPIRAQLHLLVLAPFGYGKTTTFMRLPESVKLTDSSKPGFIGTINDKGQFVPGILQKAAGKVLILDEGHNLHPKAYEALLSILETGDYERSLGNSSIQELLINQKPREFEKNYYSVKVAQGNYEIKSRFSAVMLGLNNAFRSLKDKFGNNKGALLSRMVPIIIEGSLSEAKNIAKGHAIFRPGQMIPPYKELMAFPDYEKAVDAYFDLMEKFPGAAPFRENNQTGMFIRNLGDVVRLSAYFTACEKSATITFTDFMRALSYAPLMMVNYEASALNPTEYRIFSEIQQGATAKAISETQGVPIDYIYSTRIKLMALYLLPEGHEFPEALEAMKDSLKAKLKEQETGAV